MTKNFFYSEKNICYGGETRKTLCAWPTDADIQLSYKEDIYFLESMRTDRVATFRSADIKFRNKIKRKLAREESATNRCFNAAIISSLEFVIKPPGIYYNKTLYQKREKDIVLL